MIGSGSLTGRRTDDLHSSATKIWAKRRPPLTIYTVNADGTGLREIITPSTSVFAFRWSPDGSKLLIVGDVLSVVNADGSGLRSFPSTRYVDSASWSPDGQEIVFTLDGGIRILTLKDRSLRTIRLGPTGDVFDVDWRHLPHGR
jgi:Tol biopolymer transport system component